MGKITNWQRDAIAAKAANSKYPQDGRGIYLLDEQDALAREVYETIVSKKVRAALAQLPSGWVETQDRVCFAFEFGNKVSELKLKAGDNDDGCLPSKGRYYTPIGIISGELAERVAALQTRASDVGEKHETLKRSVRAMLASVSSFAVLRKVWPEGLEFYAHMDNEREQVGLPAVQISAINEALGLPREAKVAA